MNESTDSPLIPTLKLPLKQTWIRWVYLIFASLISGGVFYDYDNPQALQEPIQNDLNIDASLYTVLYGVYAFPNMILPLFGGLFIDAIGEKAAILIFSTTVAIGQCVFTFGGYAENYYWMVAGRVLFGLCADTVLVAQSAIISKWFRDGKELAYALMMAYFCSKVFSSLNAFITPLLYNYSGNLGFPLLVGSCLAVFSVLSAVMTSLIDLKEDKILASNGAIHLESSNRSIYFEDTGEKLDLKRVHENTQKIEDRFNNPQDVRENTLKEAHSAEAKNGGKAQASKTSQEKFSCKDAITLKPLVWWLMLNSCFSNSCFWGFLSVANLYVHDRFGVSTSTAGILLTVLYFSSGVFNAIFGKIVDSYGHRMTLSMIASILLTFCFVVLTLLPDMNDQIYVPIAPLILVGLSNAIFTSAFFPSLPLLVPANQTGTAFGLMYCTMNLGLTILPEIIGSVYDATQQEDYGFFWITVMLAIISGAGVIVLLFVITKYKKETAFLNAKYEGSIAIKRSTVLQ